jgi:hypothetical protein
MDLKEVRGSQTYKEGRIALIESGTGTVVGVAELAGVIGPLSRKELSANWRKAGFDRDEPISGSRTKTRSPGSYRIPRGYDSRFLTIILPVRSSG